MVSTEVFIIIRNLQVNLYKVRSQKTEVGSLKKKLLTSVFGLQT